LSKDGFDWAERAQDLSKAAQGDADFYEIMAAELLRPSDSLVVDFGCGAGGMAVALDRRAAALDRSVAVVGLDAHEEVFAATAKTHPQLRFATASFEDSPHVLRDRAGGAPDLIWAHGALHHADDEQQALTTLARFLAPGGVLAVAEGGTTVAHMPAHLGIGERGLQLRFDAAVNEHVRRMLADLSPMPYGWPVGLRRAGLEDVRTRNVLFDKPAPLEGADLDHVLHKYAKHYEWAAAYLTPDDRQVWQRLLDPQDQFWLGHRDDLFYLAASSVHIGVKPGS
jgi:SAM-dependent methyltransferase